MMEDLKFSGDNPIKKNDADRLGYAITANHLAKAITKLSPLEGFVFGLEGSWGSGKTSLLNLIESSLKETDAPPEIIRFSPWLINSNSALLSTLFQEIAEASSQIEYGKTDQLNVVGKTAKLWLVLSKKLQQRRRKKNQDKLKKQLKKFAGNLTRLSQIAAFGEFVATGTPIASKAIEHASKAANNFIDENRIEDEKEVLKKELQKLSRKIVIFIDDLDRLTPREAAEVVRLVRAVADFPNIVYILCYSREILAQSLSKALEIEDGAAYIDKIVQVPFSVPRPEDFDLRRMFREDLEQLFPAVISANDFESPATRRLTHVIDTEGGRLKTPRDVVRAINALRLYAVPNIDTIDLADMVWLQFIRLHNSDLYYWVESYVHNVASIIEGATVSEDEAKRTFQELSNILGRGTEGVEYLGQFSEFLPGFRDTLLIDEELQQWTVLTDITSDNLSPFITERRLGSPEHFKYYFALSKPDATLSQPEINAFIYAATNNLGDAIAQFKVMASTKRPQGGLIVDVLVDRLSGNALNEIPVEGLYGIIICFANGLDIAAQHSNQVNFGRYWIWRVSNKFFKAALQKLPSDSRKKIIDEIFNNGEAIGWLSTILRTAIFSHGVYGDQAEPENVRLFSEEEYNIISRSLRRRYKEIDPLELLNTPKLLDVLYGWRQTGDEGLREVKNWLNERLEDDEETLLLFEKMRSLIMVNGTVYHPLKKDNFDDFLDFEEVVKRIESYSKSSDVTVQKRAKILLEAINFDADKY